MSKITAKKLSRAITRIGRSKSGFKINRIVGYRPAETRFPLYHPKYKDIFAMVSEGQKINFGNGKNILYTK